MKIRQKAAFTRDVTDKKGPLADPLDVIAMPTKPALKKNHRTTVKHTKNHLNGNDLVTEDLPVMVYYDWCKGCGICVAFCPKAVLEFSDELGKPVVARPEDCIQCGMCELRCPDFAITRTRRPERNGEENGNGNGNGEENSEEK